MRVGIIGFGKMGMVHGALLKPIPEVELVAITETTTMIRNSFKSIMPKIRFFKDYRKMIDKCNLDVVLITTPTVFHVPMARYAAEHGVHLFIEKPLTTTVEKGEELIEVVKKHGVKGMTGFCSRYLPTITQARKMVQDGTIGEIQSFKAQSYLSDVMKKEKGWRFNPEISGGGVVIDYTVHIIDLLYYFLGEVSTIKADAKKVYSELVEDEVAADFTFTSGVSGSIHSSWSKPGYRKFFLNLEFTGTKGSIKVSDQTLDVTYKNGKTEQFSYPDFYEGYHIDIGGPLFSIQMKLLADYITKGTEVETTLQSGQYIQKLVDAIYRSSKEKKPITIT
jgi:predicted dehydrogenase